MGSSIRGIVAPLQQFSRLELIQHRNETAGKDAEPFPERLLAQAVGMVDRVQDSDVRRRQVQGRQALREPVSGMGPYLGQEKGHRACRFRGVALLMRSRHSFS